MEIKNSIEYDHEVEKTILWLYSCASSKSELKNRVEKVAECYLRETTNKKGIWPKSGKLTYLNDEIAFFILQAEAMLYNRRYYDLELAPEIIGYFKIIGSAIGLIKTIEGISNRITRLLNAKKSAKNYLFELVVLSRYLMNGYDINFKEEGRGRTADLSINTRDGNVDVECKLFSQSDYLNIEVNAADSLFFRAKDLIFSSKRNIHIHFNSTSELNNIPTDYIYKKIKGFIENNTNCWKDNYGYGNISDVSLDSIKAELIDSSLFYGPKLNRLLTGIKNNYRTLVIGKPDDRDNRFICEIYQASSFTWDSLSEVAIEKKSSHIKSKLNDIDKQLSSSPLAIVHIGLTTPTDVESADRKHQKNIDVITTFTFKSRVVAGYLHYIMPRISESKAWMVDETVDTFHYKDNPIFLLDNPLIIQGNDNSIDLELPAWRQEYR